MATRNPHPAGVFLLDLGDAGDRLHDGPFRWGEAALMEDRQRVQRWMEREGLTQEEAALELGSSQSMLSLWLAGLREPQLNGWWRGPRRRRLRVFSIHATNFISVSFIRAFPQNHQNTSKHGQRPGIQHCATHGQQAMCARWPQPTSCSAVPHLQNTSAASAWQPAR